MTIRERRLRAKHLPSVKEGMDNLPFGIAFANFSGIVILCNRTMHRVSDALQGSELQNAEFFWEQVCERGEQTTEGAYILRFQEEAVWMLRRRQCELSGGSVYEITAQDVTERIRLLDRISGDNKRLASIGRRLAQYNKNVLELSRRRELLERKEYTHDELGRLLSATRHYLSGGDVDADALWHRWHINAALMLEEAKLPEETDLLESLRHTALSVGVQLSITGGSPRDKTTLELMLAAGGECLSNLLRHTQGKKLFIRLENREKADVLVFTDDGEAPEGKITEGGGLRALRRKAEAAGATMEVLVCPVYQLILTIPVRGGEENV